MLGSMIEQSICSWPRTGRKSGHLAAAYALTGQTDRAGEIAKRTRQMWIESSPQDLDERIQELFNTGGLYNHGNLDGSLEKGLRIAGFLR